MAVPRVGFQPSDPLGLDISRTLLAKPVDFADRGPRGPRIYRWAWFIGKAKISPGEVVGRLSSRVVCQDVIAGNATGHDQSGNRDEASHGIFSKNVSKESNIQFQLSTNRRKNRSVLPLDGKNLRTGTRVVPSGGRVAIVAVELAVVLRQLSSGPRLRIASEKIDSIMLPTTIVSSQRPDTMKKTFLSGIAMLLAVSSLGCQPPDAAPSMSTDTMMAPADSNVTATAETPAMTEAPVVEAPVVEAPVVEAPVILAPAAEVPAVEEPAAEEPAVEAPAFEEPAAEEPAFEEPAAE